MSSTATSKVGLFSRAKGSEKLLLLAYAETAHQNGTYTCPCMDTLCQWTGLTPNGVRQVRERLLQKGEIKIRPDLDPRYKTPVIDIVFGDGSNAAVIAALHPAEAPSKDCTLKSFDPQKFAPDSSVVVSSESPTGSESDNTTTEWGQKFAGSKLLTPPTDVDALLAEWEACGVAGEYLHPIAERILARPAWRDEVDDLLDYWRLWNQRVPDRPIGPAWLASELRRLSTLSQNTERQHRWCDYLPPEPASPEYWRPYAGPVDLPAPEAEAEPATSPSGVAAAVLWQQALDDLALTMPAPTFEVALRPIRAVALDPTSDRAGDDTLVLQVRDGWQTWLTRLDRDIRRALARAAGRPVTYRIETATAPHPQERAA